MVSLKSRLNYLLGVIGASVFLKFLSLLTFLSPRCGNWFKRVFFIITLYNDLKRNELFKDLSLIQVNERLLRFKEPQLLDSATDISRMPLVEYDWSFLEGLGLDVEQLMHVGDMSLHDARQIGVVLSTQVPAGLNYGSQAICADIVHLLSRKSKLKEAT